MHHDQSTQATLRATLPNSSLRALLHGLFDTVVAAVSAAQCLPAFLPEPPRGRTIVIGADKGAAAMVEAVEQHWKGELSGLVVTRYGHGRMSSTQGRIKVVKASYPVPDAAGQHAAQRMISLLEGLAEDDLVLCLISGGGSALLAAPAEGLTLADKQSVSRALFKSSVSIGEMNYVRKHLSLIKGGRLALAYAPARVETLLISNIPGDDPTLIASGPTLPDATTCADALAMIDKYGIDVPEAVRRHLKTGTDKTPKSGDAHFEGHRSHVIATAQHALETVATQARAFGYEARISSDSVEGEARDVAEVHAGIVRQIVTRNQPFTKPCVILSGGETTVTVHGSGRGGRNAEFLLALDVVLDGLPGVHVIACDTDGIDGPEDNAGTILTSDSLARAEALGLKPKQLFDNNDGYGSFNAPGDLIVTGPTRTNVNDFRAILITG